MATKAQLKQVNQKSEFLAELVDRRNYWDSKKNTEYTLAYERLIYAFTTPIPDKKNNE